MIPWLPVANEVKSPSCLLHNELRESAGARNSTLNEFGIVEMAVDFFESWTHQVSGHENVPLSLGETPLLYDY